MPGCVYVRLDGIDERLLVGAAIADANRQRRVEVHIKQAEDGFGIENVVPIQNLDGKRLAVGDADKRADLLD